MKLTPMMKQYYDLKKQYPNALLFFRLGDFYEMFGQDAEVASKVLEIALTSREAGPEGRIPMCGVPHHAVTGYLEKLIQNGFRVALCEQLEDPKQAKGVVKRDVVRVITPGTFIEGALDEKRSQYLAAITEYDTAYGLAALELSTGEFLVTNAQTLEQALDEAKRMQPAEIVVSESFKHTAELSAAVRNLDTAISTFEGRKSSLASASQALLNHFGTATLEPFGLDTAAKITAAGLALQYVQNTQKSVLEHILQIKSYSIEQFLHIDEQSRRNLELTRTIRDNRKSGSLLGVIDQTRTSMGGRLLRAYLEKPLVNSVEIGRRHDAVEQLVNTTVLRIELQELLDSVYDLERLIGRLVFGNGNARDLIALRDSLNVIPSVQELLTDNTDTLLAQLAGQLLPLNELIESIDRAIVEEPPLSVREGNLIKDGYDEELDRLRSASRGGKTWIRNLEASERKRTGIKSLKVGFNKVFGYYIEVTKPNLHLVPEEYQRKQTLANAERFITPELKEQESLVLGAEERMIEMEYALFSAIRDQVKENIASIQQNAHVLASLDVLQSLADAAAQNNYVRPVMHNDLSLHIEQGRHPVIEQLYPGFVPNDVRFTDDQKVVLLTGPNMAGKSTYLRQTALIVILAQIGSFVPASSAEIGIVDKIFTRIGAADDLSTGQSTFMVECAETAHLLLNATERSLIVLDELGRGTSTFDGMAIAQAVIEHLHNEVGARTLFSTHFHELTKLEGTLPRLATYRVEVQENQGEIYFLHQVSPGSTDRSYGINVARMAGMPKPVLKRSLALLQQFEANSGRPVQLDLFASLNYDAAMLEEANPAPEPNSPIIQELREVDPTTTTPLDALLLVTKWHKIALGEEEKQ